MNDDEEMDKAMIELGEWLDDAPVPADDRLVLPVESVGDFINHLNESLRDEASSHTT